MAEVTVTPTLRDVAHAKSNDLFDVIALLNAIEGRVEEGNLPLDAPMEAKEYAHNTLRLAQMARIKVQVAIDALAPHI